MVRIAAGALSLFMAGSLLAAAPVAAQDTRELMNRLERMERDMQILQRQINRGGPMPAPQPGGVSAPSAAISSDALLAMEQRLNALEDRIRELTGQIEQSTYQADQADKKMDKRLSDLEFRVKTVEDKAAPQAAAGTAPLGGQPPSAQAADQGTVVIPGPAPQGQKQAAAPSGRAALPPGSPEEQFKYAFDFLKANDYQKGEQAMQSFVEAHPNHALTGNAHYWLGQIHYVAKDYPKAAVSFATSYEKFPDGSKAPDSLLRLGQSLAALNKKPEACAAYKQLGTQYPTAVPALKQSAQSEIARLGCK